MKTLVLTGYDNRFEPIGRLTLSRIVSYAAKHGFYLFCMRNPPEGCSIELHPSWWKMYFLRKCFNNYDRVIWIDADILVTNLDIIPPGDTGYHCSLDWGVDATEPHHLSNCCFTAFPDCVDLVNWVIDNRCVFSQLFHEQEHVREAAAGPFGNIITVHPRRIFNAVPIEIHESAVDPWKPGDWVAHLTMVDQAERVRLVPIIEEQVEKWKKSV